MTLLQLIELHEKNLKVSQVAYENWANLAQTQKQTLEALTREIATHEEAIRLLQNCVEVSCE